MDIYVLNENLQRDDVLDSYLSLLWVERFTKSGDVTLVTNASASMIELLAERKFLEIDGSDETMMIKTSLVEDNKLKVTGNTLDDFLKERYFRSRVRHDLEYLYLTEASFRNIMHKVVLIVAAADYGPAEYISDQEIEYLDTDLPDSGTLDSEYSVPFGEAYAALAKMAETYSIGFSIKRVPVITPGDPYRLVFSTYEGRDLTSDQTDYPVVRFSPNMDTLTDIKKLSSIEGYKTVAYTFAPNIPDLSNTVGPGVAYAYLGADTDYGFDRRVITADISDITQEDVDGGLTAPGLTDLLNQKAADLLANNNYIKVIDGQIVPNNEYTYGIDYKLGDIVELSDGITSSKARITEHIKSHDKEGFREYPTVTVLE